MAAEMRSNIYKSVGVTVAADVTKGTLALVGAIVGFYMAAAVAGAKVAFCYAAEKVMVDKATGVTFTVGALVYFDASAAKVTDTSNYGRNRLIGVATEGALSADTRVEIDLRGDATQPDDGYLTMATTGQSGGDAAGSMRLEGGTVLYLPAAIAEGAAGFGVFRANAITLPKSTGASTGGAKGAKAYYDDSAKKVTAVSTNNTLIGRFAATCLDAAATCSVIFDGAAA